MSIPQAKVSKPAARQGIQKVELTSCHVNPPGERQQAVSAARDPEGGTHKLSCQSPSRTSASRQRDKGSRRRNSLAVMSIPQANVSKPPARQGIQKVELTRCHVNPPGERQQAGSAARDPEGATHKLSCQSPRRRSARRQRGKGSRRWNSPAVMSIPQANVSKPATRQGIQKVELTRCHVNPPGECQQAASAARDPEGGAHRLSCQSPRRTSASRQRGTGSRRWNSLAVMSIPQANVSKPASRQGIQKVELTGCHANPPGECQQAGSAARDPEGGTHRLSC